MEKFTQGLETMDPAELALGAGFVGMLLMLAIIGSVFWFFISAIGYRKMFMKAGEAGWKAFVPYYKSFICFKLAWNIKIFWPFLVSMFLMQFLPNTEELLMLLLNVAAIIVHFVLGIKLDIRVAKSFGKTTAWGVLLFFFPFVVSLILGYGKAEYLGNTTDQRTGESL